MGGRAREGRVGEGTGGDGREEVANSTEVVQYAHVALPRPVCLLNQPNPLTKCFLKPIQRNYSLYSAPHPRPPTPPPPTTPASAHFPTAFNAHPSQRRVQRGAGHQDHPQEQQQPNPDADRPRRRDQERQVGPHGGVPRRRRCGPLPPV